MLITLDLLFGVGHSIIPLSAGCYIAMLRNRKKIGKEGCGTYNPQDVFHCLVPSSSIRNAPHSTVLGVSQ
jgi:hypothetical protein